MDECPVAALKKFGTLKGVPVAAVTAEFKALKFAPLLNPVVNAVAPAAAAAPALPGVAGANGSPAMVNEGSLGRLLINPGKLSVNAAGKIAAKRPNPPLITRFAPVPKGLRLKPKRG